MCEEVDVYTAIRENMRERETGKERTTMAAGAVLQGTKY